MRKGRAQIGIGKKGKSYYKRCRETRHNLRTYKKDIVDVSN
jgi:hypothetical protein